MSSLQQPLHMNDQNMADQQVDLLPSDDAHRSQTNPPPNHGSFMRSRLSSDTDVMGEPVNTDHHSGHASHTANVPAGGSHAPPNFPIATPPSSAGSFPSEQSSTAYQTATSQASPTPFPYVHTSPLPGSSADYTDQAPATPNPYVRTSSLPGTAGGKTPMDSIMEVFNKWSKKAEDVTGNVWNHLRTGPNVAETALGRIVVGTKAMTEGGLENMFRQTFEVAPDEHLLKTYACYLSTSTGPVAGTLYISSHRLAFCSDRPLAIPGSPPAVTKENTSNLPASSSAETSAGAKSSKSAQQHQQSCYYKVMVPISQLQAVNPSENTQKKPPEKYVQVQTVDGHEFWFMGFVHYDKGVKNLQETLLSKNTGATHDTSAGASHDTSAAPHVMK
eukprot:c10302_g1_i1 orf=190-1353(+)